MSIQEVVLLVTCFANTVGVLGGLAISLRNGRRIEEVHLATNGMKKELVDEVRSASFARGVKSETDKEAK